MKGFSCKFSKREEGLILQHGRLLQHESVVDGVRGEVTIRNRGWFVCV